jgi:hypothetical protein
MKLTQAIVLINDLLKQHGDVEIVVQDDNNGGFRNFNPYYDCDRTIYPDKYAHDQSDRQHIGTDQVIV